MLDLSILLITAFVPMIDPFIAIGYVVAGLTARSRWVAAGAAASWTAFVFGLLRMLISDGIGFQAGRVLLASMAAALLAVGIFGVKRAVQKTKQSSRT